MARICFVIVDMKLAQRWTAERTGGQTVFFKAVLKPSGGRNTSMRVGGAARGGHNCTANLA